MKILLFLLAVIGFFYSIEASAMTESERTKILSLHNLIRQEYRLPALTWDQTIQKQAQKWADTMAKTGNFAHSSSKSRNGWWENIYMISGKNLNTNGSESSALMYWINESMNYNYSENSCASGQVCGHFTQVIWSTTRRIGCAKSTRKKWTLTTLYIVCQYDPAGNVVWQRPF
jgi:uncharacterized protein YkwD